MFKLFTALNSIILLNTHLSPGGIAWISLPFIFYSCLSCSGSRGINNVVRFLFSKLILIKTHDWKPYHLHFKRLETIQYYTFFTVMSGYFSFRYSHSQPMEEKGCHWSLFHQSFIKTDEPVVLCQELLQYNSLLWWEMSSLWDRNNLS